MTYYHKLPKRLRVNGAVFEFARFCTWEELEEVKTYYRLHGYLYRVIDNKHHYGVYIKRRKE